MRALEVHEPLDGGVAEHVRLLAGGMHHAGVEVEVAGPSHASERAWLEREGVRFHPFDHMVGDMIALGKDASTLRRLTGIVMRGRFDVVHAHGLKAGFLVRLIAPLLRVPVIYTPHGLIHRHHLVETGPRSTQHRRTLLMERVLGRVTATIIGVCEQERRWAVEDGLIAADRTVTIYNGVEVDAGARRDPRLTDFRADGPLLGYVGMLRLGKGLPLLLDALELLAARGRVPSFAIVGDGPLAGDIRERVAVGPLATTTLIAPYGGRMEPHLRAIDALVVASPSEAFPLSILEALSLGVPTVACAVGGVPEAVRDGETGLLVDRGDRDGLAVAIERIAYDRALRERMGAAAKKDATVRFSSDRMVKETLAVYERSRR
jgi:glycosyltransferase involved in cell wall biosynthesis